MGIIEDVSVKCFIDATILSLSRYRKSIQGIEKNNGATTNCNSTEMV
jgi:hypothetical protein